MKPATTFLAEKEGDRSKEKFYSTWVDDFLFLIELDVCALPFSFDRHRFVEFGYGRDSSVMRRVKLRQILCNVNTNTMITRKLNGIMYRWSSF